MDSHDIRRSLESQGFLRQRASAATTPDAPTPVEPQVAPERERAFVTDVGDKTMLVARAAPREGASTVGGHVMQLSGRFVGSEEPNRNGALWTTGDLEMGLPTVPGGPLNWLHQEHHIVGAITDARLVHPEREVAGEPAHPYIEADATMWSFLRQREAAIVREASEAGNLFYSMECVSRAVECRGCGQEFAYSQSVKGEACEHIAERSAARRFVDPVFLGGAVIVPPTRPGWADSDLRVKAHELAEATYDDHAQSVEADVWETLMASLLKLAA